MINENNSFFAIAIIENKISIKQIGKSENATFTWSIRFIEPEKMENEITKTNKQTNKDKRVKGFHCSK